MQGWVIAIIAVAYVTLLFFIASVGDNSRRPPGRARLAPLYLCAQPCDLLHVLDLLRLGGSGLRARAGISGHLYRPGAGVPVRLPDPEAHHPARQIREDHLDRRLPCRPLWQEFCRRIRSHAHRDLRHDPLYRAAVEGDFRFRQPHGHALRRCAAGHRFFRGRHGVDRHLSAGNLRRSLRHPSRRCHGASGRSGSGRCRGRRW